MKIIIYRIILLILLAATFTCIFNFSAQNGPQSSSVSQKVAKIIIDILQSTKNFVSICVGLLYAISDETHQYFIPGRQASPIDVGIDTCGVITGILIVLGIWTIVNKIKIKKSYNSLA